MAPDDAQRPSAGPRSAASLQAPEPVWRHVYTHVSGMCMDMSVDMHADMCTDMCRDVYRHVQTCVYRHVHTCVYIHAHRHVCRHVCRYVHRHVYRHVSRYVQSNNPVARLLQGRDSWNTDMAATDCHAEVTDLPVPRWRSSQVTSRSRRMMRACGTARRSPTHTWRYPTAVVPLMSHPTSASPKACPIHTIAIGKSHGDRGPVISRLVLPLTSHIPSIYPPGYIHHIHQDTSARIYPPGYICQDISTRIYLPGYICQDISARIYPPGYICQDISARIYLPGCVNRI